MKFQAQRYFDNEKVQLAFVAMVAISLRLTWLKLTNFTEEDAFITFKFAQHIANGQGFVHNLGERVYGTTTPLFTILLSLWSLITHSEILIGAKVFDLIAAISAVFFLWQILGLAGLKDYRRVLAISPVLISQKLWFHDTNGMELPVVTALMMATGYAVLRRKFNLAGLLAGLLLWTRIDSIVWLGVLVLYVWHQDGLRPTIRFALTAFCTYFPWLLFAQVYFGSIIPQTILAKYIHYIAGNEMSVFEHAEIVLRWLTPFTITSTATLLSSVSTLITLILAGLGARRYYSSKPIGILALYAVLELGRLSFTKATFEGRYFVPLLFVILVLAGLGLNVIWQWLTLLLNNQLPLAKSIGAGGIVSLAILCLVGGYLRIAPNRDAQIYRYEHSLTILGQWLNENTRPDATVLLEPLGYAGYYADRKIYDEIGLISPEIVELKRQGVYTYDAIQIIKPDYVVLLCNDAFAWSQRVDETTTQTFSINYSRVKTINPLNYEVKNPINNELARQSCYEIWSRQHGH